MKLKFPFSITRVYIVSKLEFFLILQRPLIDRVSRTEIFKQVSTTDTSTDIGFIHVQQPVIFRLSCLVIFLFYPDK